MARDDTEAAASLPYHEPGIVTILILTSFLFFLNVINSILNRICYVGLLGQVFLGIAWGTPGADWLGPELETAVVNLGYLGLLLLVYEAKSLIANLCLSSMVALTGIALPIGLSYLLMVFTSATALQAFAAGAALCSTSLGTTFTVMQTSGLNETRMGVVLTSAAMMDDVVGLIMVQVISNLGTSSGSLSTVTVIRPIFVSLGFGLAVPIACRFVILPLTKRLNRRRATSLKSAFSKLLAKEEAVFIVHTAILISMITSASYAGTSNLFAAYLTGAAISWWDSSVPYEYCRPNESPLAEIKVAPRDLTNTASSATPLTEASDDQTTSTPPSSSPTAQFHHYLPPRNIAPSPSPAIPPQPSTLPSSSSFSSTSTGIHIFHTYYHPTLTRLLLPFFFASIGFSIPITRMFTGRIVWRGFVYTLLMTIGKLACGLWLLRFPRIPTWLTIPRRKKAKAKAKANPHATELDFLAPLPGISTVDLPALPITNNPASLPPRPPHSTTPASAPTPNPTPQSSTRPSYYAPVLLGTAMVARGEIGFLISSVANANGLFGEGEASLFLIVTWAIVLCTVIGPLGVGGLVRKMR